MCASFRSNIIIKYTNYDKKAARPITGSTAQIVIHIKKYLYIAISAPRTAPATSA